jgi:hypothetical protein
VCQATFAVIDAVALRTAAALEVGEAGEHRDHERRVAAERRIDRKRLPAGADGPAKALRANRPQRNSARARRATKVIAIARRLQFVKEETKDVDQGHSRGAEPIAETKRMQLSCST